MNDINTWPSKKDFIKQMKWPLKIMYYLFIIVFYKTMPITQKGHLVNLDDCFIKTLQSSTYSAYLHFNYYNPLTYIILLLIFLFLMFIYILNSIVDMFKSTKIITVNIDDRE